MEFIKGMDISMTAELESLGVKLLGAIMGAW